MVYSFMFFMAMIGEICCIAYLGVNFIGYIEKRLKKALKSSEKVMRWINE